MAWIVDTCAILDVALNDRLHGERSARFLESKLEEGLLICSVSFVELAPQFNGDLGALKDFCRLGGFGYDEPWRQQDSDAAAQAFTRYLRMRREKGLPKRPVADILIGAFAVRFQGLITRNPDDFTPYFPDLNVVVPK